MPLGDAEAMKSGELICDRCGRVATVVDGGGRRQASGRCPACDGNLRPIEEADVAGRVSGIFCEPDVYLDARLAATPERRSAWASDERAGLIAYHRKVGEAAGYVTIADDCPDVIVAVRAARGF